MTDIHVTQADNEMADEIIVNTMVGPSSKAFHRALAKRLARHRTNAVEECVQQLRMQRGTFSAILDNEADDLIAGGGVTVYMALRKDAAVYIKQIDTLLASYRGEQS